MLIGQRAMTLAAGLLLAAVPGCSESPDEPLSTPSPQATTPSMGTESPSSAVTTPVPPSETEVASEAAATVVRDYYDMRDRLRKSPDHSLSDLETVADGEELEVQMRLFERERNQGRRQVGDTVIAELVVQSVALAKPDQDGGAARAQVDVCYDVSSVDIVDEHGNSVVSDDRPDMGWIRHTVANADWDTDPADGWLVVEGESLEKAPCDA